MTDTALAKTVRAAAELADVAGDLRDKLLLELEPLTNALLDLADATIAAAYAIHDRATRRWKL